MDKLDRKSPDTVLQSVSIERLVADLSKTPEDLYMLKIAILNASISGTGFEYTANMTHGNMYGYPTLGTSAEFGKNLPLQILRRATTWANVAPPNLFIELDARNAITQITVGGDYDLGGRAGRGGWVTEMHKVAKEFEGKPADKTTLISLGKQMEDAYLREFSRIEYRSIDDEYK